MRTVAGEFSTAMQYYSINTVLYTEPETVKHFAAQWFSLCY